MIRYWTDGDISEDENEEKIKKEPYLALEVDIRDEHVDQALVETRAQASANNQGKVSEVKRRLDVSKLPWLD